MAPYRPKTLFTSRGLGLNTVKTEEYISEKAIVTTETWGEIAEPWREGETVIAMKGYIWRTQWELGKPYITTDFYSEAGEQVGTYCDVTTPVREGEEGFECEDLYLDVWQPAGDRPILLDEDEFRAAVEAHYVSQDEADHAMNAALYLIRQLS